MMDRVLREIAGLRSGADDSILRDPEYAAALAPVMDAILAYFRAEVRGAHHAPTDAALLVGNHSGGLLTPEVYVILSWWVRHHGPEHPLFVLAHDILFSLPKFGPALRRVGGLPANWDNAERTLSEQSPVLVMPGGDYEAFRPWWERARVDFGGRNGFVRLALRTGTPIVPVVSHGSHDTTFVLTRGERLARLLQLHRIRTKVLPIVLGLPWGIAPGFVPTIPMPARITVQFLEPMTWPDLPGEAAEDPEAVGRVYDEVVATMQDALAALHRERPWPLWSR